MTRGLTLAALSILAGRTAAAQNSGGTPPNALSVGWAEPTLNARACTAAATGVSITLTNTTPPLGVTSETLYVYWTATDCNTIVKNSSHADYFGSRALSASEPLLTTTPFNFPEDMVVSGTERTFTTADALDRARVCPPDPPKSATTFRLCFSLDLADAQGTRNDSVDAGEPNAWVEFTADTLPPPAPEKPSVVGLDSALRITARVAAPGDTGDIASWRGVVRPLPEDVAEQGQPCNTWTTGITQTYRQSGIGPVTFDISADNGVTYEVCVHAIDATDNESAPSAIATGTPVPSCDFIECYPGELTTGYCGAAPVSLWSLLAVAMGLARRRRRCSRVGVQESV